VNVVEGLPACGLPSTTPLWVSARSWTSDGGRACWSAWKPEPGWRPGDTIYGFHADRRWGFPSERLGISFHGNTLTHIDSPCHIFWDGEMYNGRSHSLVDAQTGSAWAAVTAAASGIITRGVLLDIARVRDVPRWDRGWVWFPTISKRSSIGRVRVRSGDAVLLRTGYGRVRHEAGESAASRRPGGMRPVCRGCANGRSR
jgi:putative cyclase